jgi:hypothetical protein
MQGNHVAPVHAISEIHISALPAAVWDTLADIGRWGEWMPGVKRIKPPDAIAIGARFSEQTGFVTMRSELTSVQRPMALERSWRTYGIGTKALERWTLEQVGDATLVRTEQSWWGPLPRLLPGPMGNMLRSVTEDRLRALKTEVERRAPRQLAAR